MDDGEADPGVLGHAEPQGEGLGVVAAAEEEDGDGGGDVAGRDVRGAAEAAVDEDADGAGRVLEDAAVDGAELGVRGLQRAVEALVLVEGEDDHGSALALCTGAYVVVHPRDGGDGRHGADGDLAELLEGLEGDDDLVRVGRVAGFVPEGQAVLAGLVDHADGRGPLCELHDVHCIDAEVLLLLGAARGLDEVDHSGDVSDAIEAGQDSELRL